MDDDKVFYLCPTCFEACEFSTLCHGQRMIECHAGRPGDSRRKPVTDTRGHMKSREPYWFLEAVGWIGHR